MLNNKKYVVIIPSFNPDNKLLSVIDGLERIGVYDIIVVDDGSSKECKVYFNDIIKDHENCIVLTHEVNKGKGAALKTAFKYILDKRKDISGVVTADGDAQHRPEDIIKCANEMNNEQPHVVLGVRDFYLPYVPWKSRMGNKITSFVFKIFVGLKISDTQTGLRAIPYIYLKDIAGIDGNRYEYETNMLLFMKEQDIPFSEEVIDTVYIEKNRTSHFNTVKDSIRIYKIILGHFIKYALSSFVCFVVEQIIQSGIFSFVVGNLHGVLTELCSFLPARLISSIMNYKINKKYVFCDDESNSSLIRYYIVWLGQALVTMLMNYIITDLIFSTTSTVLYTVISVLIKIVIALFSFRLQREWVFKKHKTETENA